MADFISSIQKNKTLRSNSLTEMMTISGYHVKHTGPITPERSCQGYYDEKASFDIYQATKNGAVITFTVFNMSGARNNLEDTQRLISQVLTTLTFSKR